MSKSLTLWWSAGLLALASAALLFWQAKVTSDLESEVSAAREGRSVDLNNRAEDVPTRIPVHELQRLREDRAALTKLRSEIATLKQTAATPTIAPSTPLGLHPSIPAADWRPVGRASPTDAMITMLWAGTHRNLDVMSAGLSFDTAATQAKARALLSAQSAEATSFFGTPERLVAHLIASSLNVEAVQFFGDPIKVPVPAGSGDFVQLAAYFHLANRPTLRKTFLLQRAVDGWKFLVPETAIDAYAARLRDGKLKLP